jgi:hypothetical protein
MIDTNLKKGYTNYNKSSSFFLEGLALLFIALKLTGHISWSWWWVLAPIWIPLVLVALIAIVVVIYYFIKLK